MGVFGEGPDGFRDGFEGLRMARREIGHRRPWAGQESDAKEAGRSCQAYGFGDSKETSRAGYFSALILILRKETEPWSPWRAMAPEPDLAKSGMEPNLLSAMRFLKSSLPKTYSK